MYKFKANMKKNYILKPMTRRRKNFRNPRI